MRKYYLDKARTGRIIELVENLGSQLHSAMHPAYFIQIGAHVANSTNDALSSVLLRPNSTWSGCALEPVPWNFVSLQRTLKAAGERVTAIEGAFCTDDHRTFYAMSKNIDPITGWDTLSKKHLPKHLSQVGSFNKSMLLRQEKHFGVFGLNISDYIVELKVLCYDFNKMIDVCGITHADIVFIDAEGYDADIVTAIPFRLLGFPTLIIFEQRHLTQNKLTTAEAALRRNGYTSFGQGENRVAVCNK